MAVLICFFIGFGSVLDVRAQDEVVFGPITTNSYIVKYIDPNGPIPEIGGEFDFGWKTTFNDGTDWLIYSDPENDQDPVNGPRSKDCHFYAGILESKPPRLFVGMYGTGFTPGVSGSPSANDEVNWWGSALYEFQMAMNYETDPRFKIALGYDGFYSDFQRNPELPPADYNLSNMKVAVNQNENGFVAEMAFDLDENTWIQLDDPDPTSGITWWRIIVSIQGTGAPLMVWPDGDFNGNVRYLTHGSTGWDHFGWWDVTSQRKKPVRFETRTSISEWSLY